MYSPRLALIPNLPFEAPCRRYYTEIFRSTIMIEVAIGQKPSTDHKLYSKAMRVYTKRIWQGDIKS